MVPMVPMVLEMVPIIWKWREESLLKSPLTRTHSFIRLYFSNVNGRSIFQLVTTSQATRQLLTAEWSSYRHPTYVPCRLIVVWTEECAQLPQCETSVAK